ncbi:TerB family tellurite resistance protein [Oricola thermophila]|uniref:TerB family tellurite resistance protein n=1 Tax=Oricola thermophila TaxID=2742145 RepID=A0A6N1VG60_9HYPH|nr:TerB family tellurite resistance protein [Oricola thermophila]QKV19891.1 TerB family tellurite resistance protein [Oricola thermophila]
MFERIAAFFREIGAGAGEEGAAFTRDDPRLAAAALMYHVMGADGVVHESEKARLAEVLEATYSLGKDELERLIEAARDADSEAVDLYQFTSVLMKSLSAEERVHFIELLWEIVYADGVNHELEDNLVWRVSELLGVDGRERVLLRQAVQARTGEQE